MAQHDGVYKGKIYAYSFRIIFLLGIVLLVTYKDFVQETVNYSWEFLRDSWFFRSVYFETVFATLCYGVIVFIYPKLINGCRFLDEYKISTDVYYESCGSIKDFLQEAVVYISPLMILDTVMVKKYCGVHQSIWAEKRTTLIQTTRALPDSPPTVFQICFHLMASLIVFDALFFTVHIILHRNYFLYKNFHAYHHDHGVVNAHTTNKLTIVERIALILSANESLKVFNSHPMTRMLFVPVFIAILIDNHTGYDLPIGLHRLLPYGLAGGSVKHFTHHMQSTRNYQPIFTYLDKLFESVTRQKKQ